MDRKGKRLAALLCAVLMAITLLPGQVWAEMYSAEDAPLSATVVCSNPLYPELGVTESVTYDAPGTAMLAETNAMGDGGRYDSLTDVAAYVHQQFKAREQILFFYTGYPADGPFSELTAEEAQALYDAAWRDVQAKNVLPVDGDYAWLGVEIYLFRDGDSRTISATKSSYKELTQALLDLGIPAEDIGEINID